MSSPSWLATSGDEPTRPGYRMKHEEMDYRFGLRHLFHGAAGPPTKPVPPHPGKNPVATNRRSLSKT